jgi:hypothetical protein
MQITDDSQPLLTSLLRDLKTGPAPTEIRIDINYNDRGSQHDFDSDLRGIALGTARARYLIDAIFHDSGRANSPVLSPIHLRVLDGTSDPPFGVGPSKCDVLVQTLFKDH